MITVMMMIIKIIIIGFIIYSYCRSSVTKEPENDKKQLMGAGQYTTREIK